MTGPIIDVSPNKAWTQASTARVSILIPFFMDDPRPLMAALENEAPEGVELIVCDDGRPDAALSSAVAAAIADLKMPAALIVSRLNRGRSAARNRLAKSARGDWLLFLDADMAVTPGFLNRWLLSMENTGSDALFGGFAPVEPDASTKVHAALAHAGDVHDALERSRIGAAAVCSSNLAARREVLDAVPFDEAYQGWGWEDVDWALSASSRFRLAHIDNPAAHGGLESVPALLKKFARSGPNFARLLERHPEYAARPGARLALTVRRWRLAALARFAGRLAALAPAPVGVRVLGLKLYRAGVAAREL